MDLIDRKILHALQRDASLSIARIADRVGLSPTPCWKRIQRLEQTGVILGRVALVAPEQIGLGLTVFVQVQADDHSPEWREAFTRCVGALPEVMEIHRMAGDIDYLLRVAVADMAAFDTFYKRLTEAVPLKGVTSRFVVERIKSTTAYPIDTATR